MTQLDVRSQGALDIVRSGQLSERCKLPGGIELVASQSAEGAYYLVTPTSCSCPDAKYRKVTCKHQLAVRIADLLAESQADQEVQF